MYTPYPIDTSEIELSDDILALSDFLAKNTHEVWAAGRIAEGWTQGLKRNDEKKEHPCLVPYEQLSENEKTYDKSTALETLKVILKLGYTIHKS